MSNSVFSAIGFGFFFVSNHTYCIFWLQSWPLIAQRVHDVLNDYPRLRLTHGRKVLEVRPVIDWDKGKAVEFLLKSLGSVKTNYTTASRLSRLYSHN